MDVYSNYIFMGNDKFYFLNFMYWYLLFSIFCIFTFQFILIHFNKCIYACHKYINIAAVQLYGIISITYFMYLHSHAQIIQQL